MSNQIIVEKIKELKNITPRSEWVKLNRDFLLQQISLDKDFIPTRVGFGRYCQLIYQTFSQQVFTPAVLILLVLGVFLGSSIMVNAAFYSLPGDSLYKVKIVLEKTQLVLTANEEAQVELKMEFAKNRVEEFDKIISQNNITTEDRQEKINLVVQEFKNNVSSVKQHLTKISEESIPAVDKEKNLRIAVSVKSQTGELVQVLDNKVNSLSDSDKGAVQQIISEAVASVEQTSQSAQQVIDEGGTIKGAEIEVNADEIAPVGEAN